MAFRYDSNASDLDTVFAALRNAISNSFNTPEWAEIFTKLDNTSLTLNLAASTEATTNHVAVFRCKMDNNLETGNDTTYAYIILEKDGANNRIIARSCQAFSSGGSNVAVTSLANATTAELFLDTVGSDNGVSFCGNEKNVTLTVRSSIGVSAIVLACLDQFPTNLEANNAFVIFKVNNTNNKCQSVELQTNFDLTPLPGNLNTTLQRANTNSQTLSPVVAVTSNSYVGVVSDVFVSNGPLPKDYDILDAGSKLYRVFETAYGFIGVAN